MRLLLLHGLAISSSRARLISIKQKFNTNNVITFEIGVSIQDVLGSLMTLSLLSDERLIVLENPPEDFTDYTLYPIPYTLIFWFDHEVSEKKPIMEWVKKSKGEILFFPESKEVSVFPFLDHLAYGDKKAFLELDRLKKAGFDVHYFTTMIFYLLRNLAATPKTAPQFVRQKLERQRKNFTPDRVTKLYKYVLEIDFKLKSGLLEKEQAEFLLVNKFLN